MFGVKFGWTTQPTALFIDGIVKPWNQILKVKYKLNSFDARNNSKNDE